MRGLPPAVGALGLAAVFSAEISAADAVLFMLTTSLSQDLYKRFVNPAAADARVLLVARLTAVVSGGAGVLLAIGLGSVIEGARDLLHAARRLAVRADHRGAVRARAPARPTRWRRSPAG